MKLLDIDIDGNYLTIITDEGDFINRIDYAPEGIVEKCKDHVGEDIQLTVRPGTGADGKTWKEMGWFVDLSKSNKLSSTYKNKKTIRIQGGPGCGKTYQMMKIVRRSLMAGIKPEEICFLSFTNVAVDEAITRVSKEMQDAGLNYESKDFINFSTVHKLADKMGGLQGDRMDKSQFEKFEPIFKSHGFENHYTGYETVFTKLGALESASERIKDEYLQLISYSRATQTDYGEVIEGFFKDHPLKEVKINEAVLFKKLYEKFKNDNNLSDFDDSIEAAVNSDLINHTGFKVIIIDEAQDLSLNLWRVAERVINNSIAAIICGDPDQAIMDVFGANSEFFENFPVNSEHIIKRTRRLPKSHFDNLNERHKERSNHTFEPMLDAIIGTIKGLFNKKGFSALTQLIDRLDPAKEYLIMSPTKMSVNMVSNALSHERINHYRSNERIVFDVDQPLNIRVQTIWTSKGAEADNVVIAFLRKGDDKQYKKYPALRYVAESRAKDSMTFLNRPTLQYREKL